MITTLTKHGHDYALVIDESILERLNVTTDTAFEVFSDGRSLVLVPIRLLHDDQQFVDSLDIVQQQYGHTMKRLAD